MTAIPIQQLQISTLTNQNISSALLAATYTMVLPRELGISVVLSGISGNGNYQAYLTRQLAGSGTAYTSMITSDAVPSGVTNHLFNSAKIWVDATDVVKVYVVGLAGDTTGVGVTVEFFAPNTLTPATVDRPANIDSNGNIGSMVQGFLATLLTETSGQIAAAFKKLFNVAAPTAQADNLMLAAGYTAPDNTTIAAIAEALGDASAPSAAAIDTQLSGTHGAGAWGTSGNGGTLTLTYTINKPDTTPAAGAIVYLYSDSGRTALITTKVANISGVATFNNLLAGTYYLRSQLPPYPNYDDTEVVA